MVLQNDNTSYSNFILEEQNSILNLRDSFLKFFRLVEKFSRHNFNDVFDEVTQWRISIEVSI